MKLYIKQKVLSLTSKFTVKDENGEDRYFVEGEFLSLRSMLHIMNARGEEIGRIYSRLMTFLQRFILEINGEEVAEIVKKISLFCPKYELEGTSLHIEGDFWAHEYSLYDEGLATYAKGDEFNHESALGFIYCWGLPNKTTSRAHKK